MTNVHPAAKRIVVGVDGSTQSQQALRWAARIASTTHARINAVAVWDYPLTYGWGLPADWNPGDDMKKLLTETVELALGPERARTSPSPSGRVVRPTCCSRRVLMP